MKGGSKKRKGGPRRATNVSLSAQLVARARELDINLSGEFESHLERLVHTREQELWLRENAEAMKAYNRFVDEHGIWNEDMRDW